MLGNGGGRSRGSQEHKSPGFLLEVMLTEHEGPTILQTKYNGYHIAGNAYIAIAITWTSEGL